MEITYFVISITEIILTAFLVCLTIKANKKIDICTKGFKTAFKNCVSDFKKAAILLSSLNKILKLYKAYDIETTKFKKFCKTIKNLQHSLMILAFVLGIKNRKKISLKKLIKLF